MTRYNALDRLLLVILIVVVGYCWVMSRNAQRAADATPQNPGIHVQADIPLHHVMPDVRHVLTGQPDPDDSPSQTMANVVSPYIGTLYQPIPVTSWAWTVPTQTDLASGNTCAQEGTSITGQVVSVRSWRPRRDGHCYEEDATK